jgi:hypothetical protein
MRRGDLRFVTAAGWRVAYAAGLCAIVDLHDDDEISPVAGPVESSSTGPPAGTGPDR